ncbi:MAG: hypothetical protein K0R85_1662 [Devosia sp.]|nr:hypothetical protein [Devosia sp.]
MRLVGFRLLGLAHGLGGNLGEFLGLPPLGDPGGVGADLRLEARPQRLELALPCFEFRQRLGALLGEPRQFRIGSGKPFLGLAQMAGVVLEHFSGLAFGQRYAPVEFPLHARIEPQLRQLPEQLGLAFAHLAQPLGGAGEATRDFVLFAPDVAHGLVKAGQGLGSADAHCFTTASVPRREPASDIRPA